MAKAIFLQALGDYTRFKRLGPWLFLAILGALIIFALQAINPSATPTENYGAVSYMLVFRVLGLASAIYATANVSGEVEQRTIVYLLTRPVPRALLLTMRYLAAVLVVLAISVFAMLVASAAAFHGNPFANPLIGKDLLALILGAFAYGGLFVLTTLVFSRAMIICLLYAFGWELMVPQMPGTMYYLSVFSHLQAVAQHPSNTAGMNMINFLAGVSNSSNLTMSVSLPVLILIPIVTLIGGAWWYTHFEYVPRDDVG